MRSGAPVSPPSFGANQVPAIQVFGAVWQVPVLCQVLSGVGAAHAVTTLDVLELLNVITLDLLLLEILVTELGASELIVKELRAKELGASELRVSELKVMTVL